MPTELERVRDICLALPEVTERLSHGSPTWFIRGTKTVVMYLVVAPKRLAEEAVRARG